MAGCTGLEVPLSQFNHITYWFELYRINKYLSELPKRGPIANTKDLTETEVQWRQHLEFKIQSQAEMMQDIQKATGWGNMFLYWLTENFTTVKLS